MKLIIVDRTKVETYRRLREQFADDPNVKVIYERRAKALRQRTEDGSPDRRVQERRRLEKIPNGKDFVVIHVAGENADKKPTKPEPLTIYR